MKVSINGEPKVLNAPLSVSALLAQEGFAGKTVAVAINRNFVARGSYEDTQLQEGDEVDIVAPMQGG